MPNLFALYVLYLYRGNSPERAAALPTCHTCRGGGFRVPQMYYKGAGLIGRTGIKSAAGWAAIVLGVASIAASFFICSRQNAELKAFMNRVDKPEHERFLATYMEQGICAYVEKM